MAKKTEPANELSTSADTIEIEVGKCYIVESVTSNLWVGRVAAITGPHTVVL